MQLTPDQQRAIYAADTNLIVTAGAGSGKTRVLVERFLTQLQHNPHWSLTSIVAITFTEKAAREMRDRIRQRIMAYLEEPAEDHHFWRRHEAALEGARIGTIHALCTQILRANPVEARLDPAFQILDEVEAAILCDEAVERALAQMLEENAPALALLAHYDTQTLWHVLRTYAGRAAAEPLLSALATTTTESLLRTWQAAWEQDAQRILQLLQTDEQLWEALHWIDDMPHPDGDKLFEVWCTISAEREMLMTTNDPLSVHAALQHFSSAVKLNVGSAQHWGGKAELEASKAALGTIRDRARHYLKAFLPPPTNLDETAATLLLWWRDAIAITSAAFARLKDERNVLDFDDLEVLTLELLQNHPTVAYRYVHHEFNHVMVDEFQDTNDTQHRIIYALCGIDPVHHHAIPGRLFVVGDPKQSIYAFRGADVSVFDQVRDEILATGGQQISLSRSFRSHTRLVDMVNAVFGQILQRTEGPMARFAVTYEALEAQRPSAASHIAPLTLVILQKPEAEASDKSFTTENMRRWEARVLGQLLRKMVEAPTPIWDKETDSYRPLHYGDIAVLFQSMNHTPLYESVFQQAGLPYITVAGKGYFDRQEVWDIKNLLAALHSPADSLALATVLRSPMFGLSDDALLALRLRHQDEEALPLWTALMAEETAEGWPPVPVEDLPALDFARVTLQALQALTGRVTIAELLEYALELTAFEATLAGLPNGQRRRANIQKLVAVARQSQRISLGEFNRFLQDMVSSEAREGEAGLETEGAITLMSVHKSKGLEFPVVVLADCSWGRADHLLPLVVDPVAGPACDVPSLPGDAPEKPFAYRLAAKYANERDLAERKRLLYVAATRAQDYLIISGQQIKGETHWLHQLRAALSNGTHNLREELIPADEPYYLYLGWGHLALYVPVAPALKSLNAPRRDPTGWDQIRLDDAWQEETVRVALPLLQAIPDSPTPHQWHINATDLEKLGWRDHDDFRWALLHDMPRPVRPVIRQEHERNLPYAIGNVVHRALRNGLVLSHYAEDEVRKTLDTYAWHEGISDARQRMVVTDETLALLRRYETSEVATLLRRASTMYREFAFVYEHGRYVIHGIIDTLFQLDGQWHVLDYKTGRLSARSAQDIAGFSVRYLYQMGAYAGAVEQQTGTIPQVWLHYLQANYVYKIPEQLWRMAMESLDSKIEAALG